MWIESIKISNFKSYDECALKELPRGLITFFGKNGTGKSNLFDAFHFLLRGSHDYKRVSKESDLIHLISHDGHEEISVEIVLFVDDQSYFTLKKTQSTEAFKYFINNIQVTAKDFGQLFHTYGFPGSPEFYVVTPYLRKNLTDLSNQKRLDFIVSSLGQSISKGLKKLVNTMSSTEKAIYKINNVYEGLATASLNYSEGDCISKRDCYEKLLKKRDYLFLSIRFQTLTNVKRQKMEQFGSFLPHESKRLCHAKIMELENSLKNTQHNIDLVETFLEDKETERLNLLTQLEKVRFEIEESVNIHKEISLKQTFDEDLSLALAKYASIKATLDIEKTKMITIRTDLKRQESERHLIFEKLALNDNPDLIADWYNEKIETTIKNLVDKRQTILRLQKMINEEKEVLKSNQDNIKPSEAHCKEKESLMSGKEKQCSQSLKLQMQLNESRKKEFFLESAIRKSEADFNDARIQLIKIVGNHIFEGMLSVQKVISHLKSEYICNGYYGLIVANFECDPGFYNAIDASAGKKLCHHLISRMDVGNLIMKHMKLLNLPGEVTFIPLDKIKSKAKIDVQNNDANPLLSLLQYPEQFEKAMVYCFGQILICRNLEVAVNLAKIHNCLAATVEGDVVRHGGSMSGGYIKSNRSVKFNFERYAQIIKTKESQISELAVCKEKSSQILDQINQNLSRLQRIDTAKHLRPENRVKMIENIIKSSEEKLQKMTKQKRDTEEEVTILLNNLHILQSQGSIFDNDVESERLLVLNRSIIESNKQLDEQNLLILSSEKKIDNIQSKIQQIKEAQKDSVLKQNEKESLKIKILNDFKDQETLIAQRLKKVIRDIENSKKELENYHQTVTSCKKNIETINQEIKNSDQMGNLIKANIFDLNNEIQEISKALTSIRTANENLDIKENLTLKEINEELVQISKTIKEMKKAIYLVKINRRIKIFNELKLEHDKVFKLVCIASDKLLEINDWFEKHISESVEKISTLTNFYYKIFNPDMEVCLSLEMKSEELHRFVGIALNIVTFEGTSLNLESLSRSQKTALIVSIVFSITKVMNLGFIMLDEIDQFMDEESVTRFMRMISEILDVQIFATSHKKCFILQSAHTFLIQDKNHKSYVRKVEFSSKNIKSTTDLLTNHAEDYACDSEDPSSDPSFYSPSSSPPSYPPSC